jgi:glutamate/tyrosine decarboxylase-like PLP-dependent enzyme
MTEIQQSSPLFIGPKGEYADAFATLWQSLFERTMARRDTLFSGDPRWSAGRDTADPAQGLDQLLDVLRQEIPTFSPRYLGHMVSDISVPALLGHMAVLFENPNLASREAAAAGSLLETQAINELARMIGMPVQPVRGHFTSGGTVANFEAFWRARYRLDHWMSMGAWLTEHGETEQALFALAHMGWDTFDTLQSDYQISEESLRERSWVIQGPWAISRYYQNVLTADFPEPVILVPGNKHYSWPKCANVFGLSESSVWTIDLDAQGRVRTDALQATIERARQQGRPILMVVSVAGTTELGMIDPVDEVHALLTRYREQEGLHIWHHVDAAYGGYLCATLRDGESVLAPRAQRALRALAQADSVTLDPHKLGFVPYACGAILVPDARHYSVSSIQAPYLAQEQSSPYPTWSTTLEGSRAATGAGAVWLSAKVLPLTAQGHGAILNRSVETTQRIYKAIEAAFPMVKLLAPSDSNIVCFTLANHADSLAQANARAESVIAQFKASPDFACTRTALSQDSYGELIQQTVAQWGGQINDNHMTVVRMVIMNPYLDDNVIIDDLEQRLLATLAAFIEQAEIDASRAQSTAH